MRDSNGGKAMRTMDRHRQWQGPALFSFGFRPFFLFGALQAAVMVALWVPWFLGLIEVPSALPPVAWHIHELLFGYVPAVITGFLLTAIPNWTGQLPAVGWPLVGLFGLWLAGRVAIALSLMLPQPAVVLLALAFPAGLLAVMGREVIHGKNWRNLKVIVALTVLLFAQALFHYEVWRYGASAYGHRLAIAAAVSLIMIIGGRIVPSFTTNWLKRSNPGALPPPFGRFDRVAMVIGVAAFAGWVVSPPAAARLVVAALLLVAGLMHGVRLVRWQGWRTLAEPLVTVLHVAYGFVPLGFLIAAAALALDDPLLATAAIHAWTAGAIGLMTLAVMTRASRSHTGQPLTAPPGTVILYAAAFVAAVARIVAALWPAIMAPALALAAIAWVAAFLLFALLYGPMLCRRRRK